MQTLWSAAMDQRIKKALISGYMYGAADSLLVMNNNCSCNYVPDLWDHFDLGDIGSMIAPRPLVIQSCSEDNLNGKRGMINVMEQMDIIRNAYKLYGKESEVIHDIRPGGHSWHHIDLEKIPG